MTLKEHLENLKKLKFPQWPEDETLCNWMTELLEIDAYYAGLASSRIAGIQVEVDMTPLSDLENQFNTIRVSKPRDVAVYAECENYFSAIKNMVLCI